MFLDLWETDRTDRIDSWHFHRTFTCLQRTSDDLLVRTIEKCLCLVSLVVLVDRHAISSLVRRRMENLLTKMKFPYVQKLPPGDLVEAFDAHRSELKEELSYVLKLRLPQRLTHPDNRSRLRFIGWKPIPLFMQMLLKSLIVRFNFHFYGEQKTNDRRKVNRASARVAPHLQRFSFFD